MDSLRRGTLTEFGWVLQLSPFRGVLSEPPTFPLLLEKNSHKSGLYWKKSDKPTHNLGYGGKFLRGRIHRDFLVNPKRETPGNPGRDPGYQAMWGPPGSPLLKYTQMRGLLKSTFMGLSPGSSLSLPKGASYRVFYSYGYFLTLFPTSYHFFPLPASFYKTIWGIP